MRKGEAVAPARERGLKFYVPDVLSWQFHVAPARERGLKYRSRRQQSHHQGRSRKGAWIEMVGFLAMYVNYRSLPQGSVD